jgi:hypothetical protein
MNLQQFVQYAQENGGGSLHLPSGNINPTTGYMVSIKGAESKMNLSYDNAVFFCTKHIEKLMLSNDNNTWFGLWLKDGTWFYDISINMDDRDSAIAFGKANEQIAIWDCAKGDEIVLDYEEEVELYPRKCSVTGKGMSEGWCLFGGEAYASDEASADILAKQYGYDDIADAVENSDNTYWTEWDYEMDEDDNDEMWDADGNLYTWVDGKATRYVEPTDEVIDLRKNVRNHHLCSADVKKISDSISKIITDKQIEWVLDNFESYADDDVTATWDLVVENMLHEMPKGHHYAVTFTREYVTTINVTSEDESSAIVMAHDTLAEQEMEQMNVDITNIKVKKRFNLVKG